MCVSADDFKSIDTVVFKEYRGGKIIKVYARSDGYYFIPWVYGYGVSIRSQFGMDSLGYGDDCKGYEISKNVLYIYNYSSKKEKEAVNVLNAFDALKAANDAKKARDDFEKTNLRPIYYKK